jgi:hypothetical protein
MCSTTYKSLGIIAKKKGITIVYDRIRCRHRAGFFNSTESSIHAISSHNLV